MKILPADQAAPRGISETSDRFGVSLVNGGRTLRTGSASARALNVVRGRKSYASLPNTMKPTPPVRNVRSEVVSCCEIHPS